MLLGNLEDAVQADKKVEAREGFVKIAKENDFGDCQLWTRVNSLDSPWFLDDMQRIVGEVGDKVDVIMVPKVEGPWDIHYVDRLLAQTRSACRREEADSSYTRFSRRRSVWRTSKRSPAPAHACKV